MTKPEGEKRTESFTTWVTPATAQRVRSAAERLGWSPCQLIRQAVEDRLPEIERAAKGRP